jgi:RimJ/RimL family protein N-acetyltransferase
MFFDPAQTRWLDASKPDAVPPPSLRGYAGSVNPLPYPPAEVWGNLRFRAWTETDAPDYARLLSDPALWRYLPETFKGDVTTEHASDLIALANDRSRHLVRAVTLDGQAVGQVRLHWTGQPKPVSTAELAYWLAPGAQGKHIGTRMVALFLWQALRDFAHLLHVTAIIHADNKPSRALARRIGFHEDGLVQQGEPWLRTTLTRSAALQLDWGRLAQFGAGHGAQSVTGTV